MARRLYRPGARSRTGSQRPRRALHGARAGRLSRRRQPALNRALRGRSKTAAFAAAKAAPRSLAQSLARQQAPQGSHVSLLIIDGAIDVKQDRSVWTFELALRPLWESW